MTEFLELISPTHALNCLVNNLPPPDPGREMIDTHTGLGRVTFSPIVSPETLPEFPRSTVDGFAVQSRDTHGASDSMPLYLDLIGEVPMGSSPNFKIDPGQTARIFTGGMLPNGADSVIMQEYCQQARPGEIEIYRGVSVNDNCIKVGEDIQSGDLVTNAGMLLGPAQIGGLLALGITNIEVAAKPSIGIISSGDEVVHPATKPKIGQVRDINSYTLGALVERTGGIARQYGILPDRKDEFSSTLSRIVSENQAAVITAGSSASARDYTASAIQEIGSPGVLVHGINVRPGKPTILAVCDGKPVIGLPGNPVSAFVIAWLFMVPIIERLLGMEYKPKKPYCTATLKSNLPSQAGREEWIPTRLIEAESSIIADPIFFKSNLIFTLARSDGLIYIPADSTGLASGMTVQVFKM